jgi:hypothetical protein
MDREHTDLILVEIAWTKGSKEDAVERAKAVLLREGWETGSFEQEDVDAPEDGSAYGNLEVQEGLYEKVESGPGVYEATDGVVTVRFECLGLRPAPVEEGLTVRTVVLTDEQLKALKEVLEDALDQADGNADTCRPKDMADVLEAKSMLFEIMDAVDRA